MRERELELARPRAGTGRAARAPAPRRRPPPLLLPPPPACATRPRRRRLAPPRAPPPRRRRSARRPTSAAPAARPRARRRMLEPPRPTPPPPDSAAQQRRTRSDARRGRRDAQSPRLGGASGGRRPREAPRADFESPWFCAKPRAVVVRPHPPPAGALAPRRAAPPGTAQSSCACWAGDRADACEAAARATPRRSGRDDGEGDQRGGGERAGELKKPAKRLGLIDMGLLHLFMMSERRGAERRGGDAGWNGGSPRG